MKQLTTDNLIAFIQDHMGSDADGLEATTVLFSSGLIDSFSMAALMTYIEEQVDILIPTTDVTLENMDTVQRIADYVKQRQARLLK